MPDATHVRDAFNEEGAFLILDADMTGTSRKRALFFVLALAMLAIVSPARAHDGPAAAVRATQAASALQAYGDGVRKAGHRPDFAAAPAADLLRVIFDADGLAAMPAPASQDVPWMMDWFDAANRSYKQMILVGLSPGQPPDEAKLARNLRDYEDQIVPAMSFLLRGLARETVALAMFLDELPEKDVTPVRVAGFRGLRSAAGEFLQSVLCTAQAIKPGNALTLMTVIYETRAVWTDALYVEDRAKVMAHLKQIVERFGDKGVSDTAAMLLTAFSAAEE